MLYDVTALPCVGFHLINLLSELIVTLASGLVLENAGVLLEPALEVGKLSGTVVGDTLLVVSRVEDQSGEALDLNTLGLVGGGVELGDDEVLDVLVLRGELVPDGRKLLAVAAPRGVVLDQHVLGLVEDELLEVLANDNGERAIVGLGLGRLEVGLDGAALDVINELSDGGDGQIGSGDLGLVLLHVTGEEGPEAREHILGDADELSESGLDAIRDGGVREEHLALVGLGGFLEDTHERGRLVGIAAEQEEGRLLLAEDGLDLILRELEDGRDHEGLDPADEVILLGGAGVGDGLLLEGAEEDDARGGSAVLGGTVSVLGVDEGHLVLGLSEADEGVLEERIILGAEVGEHELVVGDLLLQGIAGDLGGGRAGLLQDPADDGVLGAATSVLLLLTVPKVWSENQIDTYHGRRRHQSISLGLEPLGRLICCQ